MSDLTCKGYVIHDVHSFTHDKIMLKFQCGHILFFDRYYLMNMGTSVSQVILSVISQHNHNVHPDGYPKKNLSVRRPPIDGMPGLSENVKHPVHGRMNRLERVIISLNDTHKWTREQIADWLETLDIDLTFKMETSV